MLIIALVLALIGLAALVFAVVTSNAVVAWVCIGASALGVLLLIIDALRERRREHARAVVEPTAEPAVEHVKAERVSVGRDEVAEADGTVEPAPGPADALDGVDETPTELTVDAETPDVAGVDAAGGDAADVDAADVDAADVDATGGDAADVDAAEIEDPAAADTVSDETITADDDTSG